MPPSLHFPFEIFYRPSFCIWMIAGVRIKNNRILIVLTGAHFKFRFFIIELIYAGSSILRVILRTERHSNYNMLCDIAVWGNILQAFEK